MAIKGDGIGQHQHHGIGISPPKPARIGKNSTPAPIAVPNRPVRWCQIYADERLVWLDAMLSVVLISCPHLCIELSVNKTGNLRYPGEIDIAPEIRLTVLRFWI